ncbi:hypothetical protein [Nocardia salmonicida]|uniref:hypothetical protein n=1 Tax=Nocardia salmonicida TaxID=53431 RepID=UPI003796DA72
MRVARLLRRSNELDIDYDGEKLLTGLIYDCLDPVYKAMDSPDYDPTKLTLEDRESTEQGIEFRTHWVAAPDGQPVGLIVWLAPGPVAARPVYNSWILDHSEFTTVSAGDNLSIIGDGRVQGQPRPIRDLLRYANAEDAANFLALVWDLRTGDEGLLGEAMWSIYPPGAQNWVHFFSSANVGCCPHTDSVYGMSVQMPCREFDPTMGAMVAPNSTLVLVDPDRRITIHATGDLREELRDHHITTVLDLTLGRTTGHEMSVDAVVTINGRDYHARVWVLPSIQRRPIKPTAILLRPASDDTAA